MRSFLEKFGSFESSRFLGEQTVRVLSVTHTNGSALGPNAHALTVVDISMSQHRNATSGVDLPRNLPIHDVRVGVAESKIGSGAVNSLKAIINSFRIWFAVVSLRCFGLMISTLPSRNLVSFSKTSLSFEAVFCLVIFRRWRCHFSTSGLTLASFRSLNLSPPLVEKKRSFPFLLRKSEYFCTAP